VEHPERQGRASQVARKLPVATANESQGPLEIFGRAEVFGRQGASLDEAKNQRARREVDDLGRKARGMSGSTCRRLVETHHPVDRNVVSDPHEERLSGVLDAEIRIGETADDGLRLDGTGPARKSCRTLPGIRTHPTPARDCLPNVLQG
jgi:hypothetical protein